MKNILILFSLLLFSFPSQAQIIIPIEEAATYIENNQGNLPKYKYYKDVNKILDKYVGTWEGTHQGKSYYFLITKKIEIPSKVSPSTLRDDLVVRFRITDNTTKQVLYNKFNLPEKFHLTHSKIGKLTINSNIMIYGGNNEEDIECGDVGDMYLELFENNEKLKVYVKPEFIIHYIFEDEEHPCPNGDVLPPFPNKEEKAIVLTKKKDSFIQK